MSLLLLFASLSFVAVGAAVLKTSEIHRLRSSLVTYQLRFPRQLEDAAVVNFLAGLSGLILPWWRRLLTTPFVVCEVRASKRGVEHYLSVPGGWEATIENLLQAHMPAARYELVDASAPTPLIAAEYRLSTGRRLLRIDAGALSARLLTSLQPLSQGEQVIVQWVATPAGPVSPVRPPSANDKPVLPFLRSSNVALSTEEAAALREKQAQPLLLGVARIGARAGSRGRARALLRQVETSWHSTRAPGVHLRRRVFGEEHVAARMSRRAVPLSIWPGVFNSAELAGLIGWPIAVEQITGLVLGGSRAVPPSPLIPTSGTVIGMANFPGSARPVALELEGRLRHLHVVGPTGTGKSTLLLRMLEQDIRAGRSVVCVDFKGDLVVDLCRRLGGHRDVVVLDPADAAPVGLNPLLAVDGERAEVVVENLVGLFRSLFGSNWGPRSDDLLRGALRTLAASGDFTLCEVSPLLLDPSFRRRLVGRLDDPSLQEFWGWYEGLSDAERINITAAPLNKLRAFVMRPAVRAIVGQAQPTVSMSDVVNGGKVLLVSLAAGLLGTEAASLLGALVFAELWHTTLARAGLPAAERRPCMAYLDEFQNVVRLPTPMPSVLAESRGLSVGYVVAHQHMQQLSPELRDAVLANARSRSELPPVLRSASVCWLMMLLGGCLVPVSC